MVFALVGLVIVLLVGGGAFGAAALLGSGGPGAAAALPGSVSAFAAVDLDVSTDQQVKLADVAEKIPELGEVDSPEQLIGRVVDQIDEEEKLGGALDGWVGLTVAIALWTDADGNPFGLVSVASTDDAKAEQGLSELAQGEFGYVVSDGLAVIAGNDGGAGDPQAAAEAAAAEIRDAPLSEDARFEEAGDWLGDDQVVSIWADMPAVSELMRETAEQAGEGMAGGSPLVLSGDLFGDATGQVAVGGHATSFGLELRSRSFGAAESSAGDPGLLDRMAELPPSDIAGIGVLPEDLSGAGGLVGAMLGFGLAEDTDPQVQGLLDALGGSTVTATFDGFGQAAAGQLSVETDSAEEARIISDAVGTISMEETGTVSGEVDGSTYRYGTPGYVPPTGRLGDVPAFADAVDDTVQQANLAVYLNLSSMDSGDVPVEALGVVSGTEDGQSLLVVRVILA